MFVLVSFYPGILGLWIPDGALDALQQALVATDSENFRVIRAVGGIHGFSDELDDAAPCLVIVLKPMESMKSLCDFVAVRSVSSSRSHIP